MVQHDNNTIRHQEDTATNGTPDDDKATSTKDKTIIIHNHIHTDTMVVGMLYACVVVHRVVVGL
jgi:hypothetical protein